MGTRTRVLKVLAKMDPPPPTAKMGKKGRKIRAKNKSKKLVKRAKKSTEKIDGWSPKNIQQLRSAIRQVWSWSEPHRKVRKRCLLDSGFSRCEKCKTIVPKVYVDHIQVMGSIFGERYLERMGAPSSQLQGLCKKCHDAKTKLERIEAARAAKDETDDGPDFY